MGQTERTDDRADEGAEPRRFVRPVTSSPDRERRTIALAFIAALLPAAVAGQESGIFTPPDPTLETRAAENIAPPDSITLRRRLVRVDIDRLAQARATVAPGGASSAELRLNLFADAVLTGIVETTSPTPSGYLLSGRIEGLAGSTLTIVVNGTVVAGTIRTAGGTWRIRSVGDGLHVVSRVDESRLPPGGEPLRPPPGDADFSRPLRDARIEQAAVSSTRARIAPGPSEIPRTADPIALPRNTASRIDVAVFYTPAARRAEGGTAGIEALIDLMVAETNRAYADSGVQQRVALVARGETAYSESGRPGLDLGRLRSPLDRHMDGVHPIRNRSGADLVHLIGAWDLEATRTCGIAWIMLETSPGFSSSAFGLTHHACGGRTFAHELGHNMGLAHDRYQECDGETCGGAAYPYGYGYVNQRAFDAGAPESARWRTIMAYNTQCGEEGDFYCERPLRFSNPRQTYRGDRLGIAGDVVSPSVTGPSDAVRALNHARATVESFRSGADANSPELVVDLTVDDTATTPGRTVTLAARVVNHGGGGAPATSLTFSSWEPVPNQAGFFYVTALESATVGSLVSGASTSLRTRVTVPSSQGRHFYRAAVDAVAGEIDGDNNRSRLVNAPVIVPSCETDLGSASGLVTRRGSWDGSCPSAYYPFGEYARYYHFTLHRAAPVTIDLASASVNTWLALRSAAGLVDEDDDGGQGANSRISRTLDAGAYTIEATTYAGGVTGPFTLSVHVENGGGIRFTDDPIEAGVTPIRPVHFTELRAVIDGLRVANGLGPFPWTDPTPAAGLAVRAIHVAELRTALRQVYDAAGRTARFTTGAPPAGSTIRAWHINELRRAAETVRQ